MIERVQKLQEWLLWWMMCKCIDLYSPDKCMERSMRTEWKTAIAPILGRLGLSMDVGQSTSWGENEDLVFQRAYIRLVVEWRRSFQQMSRQQTRLKRASRHASRTCSRLLAEWCWRPACQSLRLSWWFRSQRTDFCWSKIWVWEDQRRKRSCLQSPTGRQKWSTCLGYLMRMTSKPGKLWWLHFRCRPWRDSRNVHKELCWQVQWRTKSHNPKIRPKLIKKRKFCQMQ